jgi:hypothetical protein
MLTGAALAAAPVVLAGPAAAAEPVVPAFSGRVVVPSDGSTVTTPFATVDGVTYRFTVTGTYDYNGWGNLADCGHWNPEDQGTAWWNVGNLRVDGVAAPCAGQPYSPAHVYGWEQPGTGEPYSFRIVDAFYWDNTGALTVDIEGVWLNAPYEIDGGCEVLHSEDTQLGLRMFDVVVHATASGGSGVPPLLDATCEFRDGMAVVATVDTPVPAPVTAGAGVLLLPRRGYLVCLSVTVTYVGDLPTRVDEPCRTIGEGTPMFCRAVAGVLAATALCGPAAASPAGADGGCEVVSADDSQVGSRAYVVAAHAQPNGQGIFMPVTQVICHLVGNGVSERVDTGAYGPVAASVGTFVVPLQSYQLCANVLAGWGPGDWYLNRFTCRTI